MSVKQRKGENRLTEFFSVLLEELSDVPTRSEEIVFAVNRQVQRMRKRARFNKPELEVQAVNSFLGINDLVARTKVTLDRQIVEDARYFITNVLWRFTSTIDEESIQQTLNLPYLYDNWRFGPGAANGITGTHAAEKIVQDMTCTAPSEPFVRKLRHLNPYFSTKDGLRSGTVTVEGSRLATVPKNEDTVRTIAIEPLGNMALQLAAGRYLEGALRMIGLDISTQQPKNKAMAMRGSITDSLATIDLKSASDMISLDLVRQLMPLEWDYLLRVLRSEYISIKGHGQVKLNMISTMGNGFTFPLMTLIISALIYGFRAQRGGPNLFIDWTSTCVFGDDIIIPSDEYDGFTKVLSDAGLIVNHDKSYSAGPFRESCGGDYYRGFDVTPFYVKSLATPSDIYVALNQVLEWSGKVNLFLPRTLGLLKSYLGAKVFLVPEWCNPDEGIRTARCSRRYNYLSKSMSRKRLTPSIFDMMLAIGGYVDASGPDLFYTPRSAKSTVRVRASRLPRGYLDGRDPLSRSRQSSDNISTFVDIAFG